MLLAARRFPAPVLLVLALAAALLAPILAPVPAAAQERPTRVAAPNGTAGGEGTEARPWTLRHGLLNVQPGEQLLLRGGTYAEDIENLVYNSRRTSAAAPIRVAAWPGERPLIRSRWNIRNASWWIFEGLTIEWPGGGAGEPLVKLMSGTGWVFRGNEVRGAVSYANVYVGQAGDTRTPPSGWALLDNCIHTTRHAGGAGNTDHNLYIQNGLNAPPGLVEGNLLYGAPRGMNIKLGSPPGSSAPSASNVTIRYNTLFEGQHNLLVEPSVRDVLIERNIMGRVLERPEQRLGNMRSNGNQTGTVLVRDNVAWWSPELISNTVYGATTRQAAGIVDGGGNRFSRDPRFNAVSSCGQFQPSDGGAIAYGHRARVERVAGTSRIATAVELSRKSRPGGARTVLLARADAYPDALAGAPLAQKLGAPLLLTSSNRLDAEVAAEIDRLGAREVVVLGGTGAVSAGVARDAQARRSVETVRRISGPNRFETSRAIAREVGGTQVYVVEGQSADANRGWPDAVSVSGLAAREQRPILLVTARSLPDGTKAALADLGAQRATIVGGTGAVSAGVQEEIGRMLGGAVNVERIAGSNRYETSVKVAERAVAGGANGRALWIATGVNWPDALAAGPAAAATGGVLVLAPGNSVSGADIVTPFIRRVVPAGARPRLVGGRGAIEPPVEDRLASAVPAR